MKQQTGYLSRNSLDTVSTITGEEIKSNYLQEIANLKRFLEFKALEKQDLEKEELVSRLGVVLNSELTDFE